MFINRGEEFSKLDKEFSQIIKKTKLKVVRLPETNRSILLLPAVVYPDRVTNKYLIEADSFKEFFDLNGDELHRLQNTNNYRDDVFLKVYDIREIFEYYFRNIEHIAEMDPLITSDEAYHRKVISQFTREVKTNKFIRIHNESCSREEDKINCPDMLSYGAIIRENTFYGFYICFQYIKVHERLSRSDIPNITHEVEKLHKVGVTHGKLMENISVNEDGTVTFFDFASAHRLDEGTTKLEKHSDVCNDFLSLLRLSGHLEKNNDGSMKNPATRLP